MSFYLILVYEINVYITTFAYILFNNSKIRHLPCPWWNYYRNILLTFVDIFIKK